MPLQPGVDPDFKPPHKAVPHVVPNSDPPMFTGSCAAGDFAAQQARATEGEAIADVNEHLAQIV